MKPITAVEKSIIKYYNKMTPKELANFVGHTVPKVAGLRTSLVKRGLIENKSKLKTKYRIAKSVAKAMGLDKSFSNDEGLKKAEARGIMIDAIYRSKLVGKILSLPCDTATIEKMIATAISPKFRFVGVECEDSVYRGLLLTLADSDLDMSVFKGYIDELIDMARENEYAHLILDYCGTFDTFYVDVANAIKKNIVQVGGTIALTVAVRRKAYADDSLVYKYSNLNPSGHYKGNEIINGIRTYLDTICKDNYVIDTELRYKDKGHQAMVLMVIRRIK